MKIVLALGMSRPLSTIVVDSSRSNLCGDEIDHHRFQLVVGHLGVADPQPHVGHDLPQAVGDQLDVADAVVDEVDLPAAGQLALDRVADQLVVPAGDLRLDGQAILGRRFQVRDVAQADQRHVQRPRDRRGRERQHIDHRPQRLQPLFDIDAEPLLFVDDDQAQVVELDVLRGQAVRADDDIDLARLQPGDRGPLFLRRAKPAELGDVERELGHPLAEAVKVLLGEDRRRHEHRHLVAAIDRFERGPHGDFGLAEADVAAEQAVHRPRPQHVGS